jgi:hypothetical protein
VGSLRQPCECRAHCHSMLQLHFKIKWMPQTDLSQGGCSYATGCFNIDKCKVCVPAQVR